jgi:cation transport regulator ChaC
MKERLYFAYGSNLLTTRLKARCGSVQPLSTAFTQDWSVNFAKPGRDGSAKAGLIEDTGTRHPGVIYRIAESELSRLDAIEGLGHGYTREDGFEVELATGESVSTFTYIPTRHDPDLKPFDWYLALCIAGAHEHGFDTAAIDGFRRAPSRPDPHPDRPARIEGISALEASGHVDWSLLLKHQA